jgi:2-polyprenyl-6-methoxyphenol hydroxylase-like FAD-dependent oxidoreductase
MGSKTYDLITVGGGLGGSALAKAMAEHGARVLVVERERRFKDRVRGEAMHPWGSRRRVHWGSMGCCTRLVGTRYLGGTFT